MTASTPRAAEFLGTTHTMGAVDVGKNADLVLLTANPADDAAALHQVSAVIRDGRHYSPADLAGLKDRVRSAHPAT
jgi:imidazolonepropionase-like amidohydrolase